MILQGDAQHIPLPDGSVHCVVISFDKLVDECYSSRAVPARKLPPNEELLKMYNSGMSSGEIAERTGAAPVTVCQGLRRAGLVLRTAEQAAALRTQRGRARPARFWLGKKQPPEMVERRVSKIRGENHYLWAGGRSRRGYRKIVHKTKCENCGSRLNLGIHHRDLNHYNDAPENLSVLCASCHMGVHKKAYWAAKRQGLQPPKGNGPVGWGRGK